MSDASGSGRCTLNEYLPKTATDAAIGEAVPRLQYSRAIEKQTSAIREFVTGKDMLVVLEKQTRAFVTGRRAGRFANGRWQVAQHQPPCGV